MSETAVDAFHAYRRLLFSIAYRMTGSAADADELVQEAYFRYLRADPDAVREPRAFLVTTVTRLALDRLGLARTQRETYWGTWLPEPVLSDEALLPEDSAVQRESLSLAFLALLERLTPPERAVFVLREAFGYPYAEIAAILDLAEAHCRQLFRRASKRAAEGGPRYLADPQQAQGLLERFMAAALGAGTESLEDLLAEDAMAWGDGGGLASAVRVPLVGRERTAQFIRGLVRTAPEGLMPQFVQSNGTTALVLSEPRGVIGLYELQPDEHGRIAHIFSMRNPEKLARVAAALSLPVAPPVR